MSYGGLAQVVDSSAYGSRGACADACLHACFSEYGEFVISFVPMAAEVCQAFCMDRSGCTDLPITDPDFELPGALLPRKPWAPPAPAAPPAKAPPTFPWGMYSEDTQSLQAQLNVELAKLGLCPLEVTGKLDAPTCGALARFGEPLKSCEGFVDPAPCPTFDAPSAAGLGTFLLVAAALGATYLVLR